MKYLDVFKKWWFWLVVVILSVIVMVSEEIPFSLSEFLLTFIGATIVMFGFYTFFYLIAISYVKTFGKRLKERKINI